LAEINSKDLPEFEKDGFVCPHCHHQSQQHWGSINEPITHYFVDNFGIASCNRCHEKSIWAEKKMVYPLESSAPLPHEDIPSEIKPLFEQARKVLIFFSTCFMCIVKISN